MTNRSNPQLRETMFHLAILKQCERNNQLRKTVMSKENYFRANPFPGSNAGVMEKAYYANFKKPLKEQAWIKDTVNALEAQDPFETFSFDKQKYQALHNPGGLPMAFYAFGNTALLNIENPISHIESFESKSQQAQRIRRENGTEYEIKQIMDASTVITGSTGKSLARFVLQNSLTHPGIIVTNRTFNGFLEQYPKLKFDPEKNLILTEIPPCLDGVTSYTPQSLEWSRVFNLAQNRYIVNHPPQARL